MRLPMDLPNRQLTSDDWYTPPYIFDALGLTFDLDPCGPKGGVPWIPNSITFTEQDDGLSLQWKGRVWLNPPYSQPGPWVIRLAHHREGVCLVPADLTAPWWNNIIESADGVLFLKDRVTFLRPDNDNVTSAMYPSAMASWGVPLGALRDNHLGYYWQLI